MKEIIHLQNSAMPSSGELQGQASLISDESRQAVVHSSAYLLRGGSSALISHEGQVYTLRLTAQKKLILTK